MKRLVVSVVALLSLMLAVPLRAEKKPKEVKLDGYLEWLQGDFLIVDGQRVVADQSTKFKGEEAARDLSSIPLGYECKVKGHRRDDGAIAAREIEAKPNGSAMFEAEILTATNQMEAEFRRAGMALQPDGQGGVASMGKLHETGPHVDRVRRIVNRLAPPYLNPDDMRAYVIENTEWNAFAMGNYSFYAYSGLLNDMDDDELAIIMGHELAHASHEHSRRQAKRDMWIQLAALGVVVAANEVDDQTKRIVIDVASGLVSSALVNGYSRQHEDQADRVGLRYAYEGGYDIRKGPSLWRRFAEKYGDDNQMMNFFFGDHSLASKRVEHLEDELALNYAGGPKARVSPADWTQSRTTNEKSAGDTFSLRENDSAKASNVRLRQGMTPEEVREILGPPQTETTWGDETRWRYPDMTVVFEKGRLKEVKF